MFAYHALVINVEYSTSDGCLAWWTVSYFRRISWYTNNKLLIPTFMACTMKTMCTTKCNALITVQNMWLSVYLLQGCLACFGHDFGAFNWLRVFNIKNRITLSWITWYMLPNKPFHPQLHVLQHENHVTHHMWRPDDNAEHVVGCWPLASLPITCCS